MLINYLTAACSCWADIWKTVSQLLQSLCPAVFAEYSAACFFILFSLRLVPRGLDEHKSKLTVALSFISL